MIETFTISVFGQKEGFMVKYGPRELCIRFVCHYYKIVWIRGAYPQNVDKIYIYVYIYFLIPSLKSLNLS